MGTKRWLVSAVMVTMGIVTGLFIAARFNIVPASTAQEAPAAASAVSGGPDAGFEGAIERVSALVGRGVVSISSEQTTKIGGGRRYYFRSPDGSGGDQFDGGQNDEIFKRFFDDFFGGMPEREYKRAGLGSGVIIDPSGIILTNQHVIDQADKITVTLPDGREFKAEVKGQDARSDLAVIKIEAKDLPSVKMGDSASLRIGQWVVAVGNPFGFALQNPEPTVTSGVISALHRSLGRTMSRERSLNDLIQTDAAINPGNSGGPLVNLKGEVVGINVAIFSTTGGSQGIGFAIPVNNIKRVLSQLMSGKPVQYGWLGVSVQDLTQELAAYFGLSEKSGALVVSVIADGPGDKAGMKDGDIIRQIGAARVNNVKELLNIVGSAEVGKRLPVKVLRDKKEISLDLTVGNRPSEDEIGDEGQAEGGLKAAAGWRGMEVGEPGAEGVRRPPVEVKDGVMVTAVKPGSPADDAGIIPGDVILEINRQKTATLADYRKAVKAAKGDALVRTARGFVILKEAAGGK